MIVRTQPTSRSVNLPNTALVDLSAGFNTNAIYKPAALQLVTSEASAAVQILDILQLNLLSAMKEESLGERLIF
ncbi:hypothetical protein ACHWQZ_G013767 [Mnemiopsis leidyi]